MLVVCHRWERERSERGLVRALEQELGAQRHEIEDGWPPAATFRELDCVVVFVRFRELAEWPPLEWGGFSGTRVMLEHDAYQNYVDIAPSRHKGRWPDEFRRHRFDLLVVSGKEVAGRLQDDGVSTAWLPKGYDDAFFEDAARERAGLCTYGSRYRARAAMLRHIDAERLAVTQVSCRYEELGSRLNEHLACIVCNMQGRPHLGRIGRALNRRWPGALMAVGPGIEPMIKNFEAAAAGCAVFADRIPELTDLGFIDGETFVEYRDFDELVDKARRLDPGELRAIGRAGARLCVERHTWRHRARQLVRLVTSGSET